QTADSPMPDLDRPVGVPASYADHARLMFDLQVLALQGDVTRVITFQLARETSNRTYPEIGVPDPHHPLSHHGNDPSKLTKLAKINLFHTTQFAYFIAKLKATKEGAGSLLDNCMVVYGSGLADPNRHAHHDLPILLAGGGGGTIKPGRHVKYESMTPMTNLYLSLLERIGVNAPRLGDSTGKLGQLA
ncbi:MAG: DUF1552 domain-containing protein, partial [Verrucomicrobia bacterium]|nr:DUF1552 domain-containing protein [Verrucomicrobiota bacterium]